MARILGSIIHPDLVTVQSAVPRHLLIKIFLRYCAVSEGNLQVGLRQGLRSRSGRICSLVPRQPLGTRACAPGASQHLWLCLWLCLVRRSNALFLYLGVVGDTSSLKLHPQHPFLAQYDSTPGTPHINSFYQFALKLSLIATQAKYPAPPKDQRPASVAASNGNAGAGGMLSDGDSAARAVAGGVWKGQDVRVKYGVGVVGKAAEEGRSQITSDLASEDAYDAGLYLPLA